MERRKYDANEINGFVDIVGGGAAAVMMCYFNAAWFHLQGTHAYVENSD